MTKNSGQKCNPNNKAGLFEGSFFWGRGGEIINLPPSLHISRRINLTSIKLYVKQMLNNLFRGVRKNMSRKCQNIRKIDENS